MPRSFRWVYVLILWCSLGGGFILARVVMTSTAAESEYTSSVPPVGSLSTGTPVDEGTLDTLNDTKLSVDDSVYLPLIVRGNLIPPPPPPPPPTSLLAGSCNNGECRFDTAGMFLGVRPFQDWNRTDPIEEPTSQEFDFLCRVRGNEQNCPNAQNEAQLPGVWPAVVVVLSNEVFNVVRFEKSVDEFCNIAGVNSTGREHIYEYLAQASQRGIPIIVRLASPGNFEDTIEFDQRHRLILAPAQTPLINDPVEGMRWATYCDSDLDGRTLDPDRTPIPGYRSFRSIDDLLNEMGSILGFLDVDDRFNLDNIYFLPANEPNGEWYGEGWWTWGTLYGEPPPDLSEEQLAQRQFEVNTEGIGAWDDMNRFFSALYRRKEQLAMNEMNDPEAPFSNVNILTPPMGPGQMAEMFDASCMETTLLGPPDPETDEQEVFTTSGYAQMLGNDPATDVQEGMLQPILRDAATNIE